MLLFASIALVMSSLVSLANLTGVIGAMLRNRRGDPRGYSCVPVLSIVFGSIAWLLAGSTFGWWSMLPALLDPGTWMIIVLPFYLLWSKL